MLAAYKKMRLGLARPAGWLARSLANKKVMAGVFVVLVLGGLLFLKSPAMANTATVIGNGFISAVTQLFLWLARMCMGMTIFFLRLFTELAQYNSFIDAPPVVIGWLMVRDIANMFFVVALLVIAFGTILGLEQYEWKKTLIKLILAAIFINFSKLILQLLIDFAHVFTITFLNAIQGTAAGNLINLLHFDAVLKMTAVDTTNGVDSLRGDLFVAGVMALVLTVIAMIAMGAYLFIMLARLVVLWVLIILSPLAFIASVLPNTKSYADEFWKSFTHHVLVAPVMVFFLWLTFATLGSGNIASEIGIQTSEAAEAGAAIAGTLPPNPTLSLSEATTWENFASFLIAIGFMVVGIAAVQKLGVVGGGAVAGAVSFGKKVATIASGAALGIWAARGIGRGAAIAGKYTGLGVYKATGLSSNVERLKKRAQREWTGFQSKYLYQTPFRVKVAKGGEQVEEYDLETGQKKKSIKKAGDEYLELAEPKGFLQKWLNKRAVKEIASEKMFEKTENFLKQKKEILQSLVQGVPTSLFKTPEENVDAMDRRYGGILDQLKNRSAKKTEVYKEVGMLLVGKVPRIQYRTRRPERAQYATEEEYQRKLVEFQEQKLKPVEKEGAQMEEVQGHVIQADRAKAELHSLETEAKITIIKKAEEKRAEGELKPGYASLDDIRRAVAAERAAHTAGEEYKEKQKKAEVEYLATTPEGAHELAKEAELKLQIEALEKEIKQMEVKATAAAAEELKDVIERINFAEQGVKLAEEFVKTLKNEDLAKQFKNAAKQMSDWLKEPGKDLKALLESAQKGNHGAYIGALANAQVAKVQESTTGIRRRQAEDGARDVFVHKGRYGSTSPSTAFAEYAEAEMKEFRKYERLAGMKKATNIMVHLKGLKDTLLPGQSLAIDQEAKLAAAVSFLTEEAWVDDQGEHLFGMLKTLKAHQKDRSNNLMTADQEETWKSMAGMFYKIGWIRDKEEGKKAFDEAGNMTDNAIVIDKYGRKEAADLQNLAITGLDVELVEAHNKIAQIKDDNVRVRKTREDKAKEEALDKANEKIVASPGLSAEVASEEQIAKEAEQGAIEKERKVVAIKARVQAAKEAKELPEPERMSFIDTKVREAELAAVSEVDVGARIKGATDKVRRAYLEKAAKSEIETAVRSIRDEFRSKTDYWAVAEDLMQRKIITTINNKQELKGRYDRHADLMQFATRTFKKNALETGHEELGMNQDFDETEDVYRFQTVEEGRSKLRADRVKIAKRKLLTTDQYHSNGRLDFATGILDDFLEETLSITLGRVSKAIEMTDMPERSLKGHFYIHKNDDAVVETRRDADGQVRRYAVVGSDKAVQKFVADGDVSQEQQRNHMLSRGLLTHLMSGWKGMAIASHKLYGHITEKEAQEGIINQQVGGMNFRTVKNMAEFIKNAIESGDKNFMGAFNVSNYRGQEVRVLRQMRQIMNENPRADFGSNRAAEEEAATGSL